MSATRSAAPLCRDCSAAQSGPASRCASCGSPRLIWHPELDDLAIAHVDCDAFYATIEKRDDPSLRDKPLIIGGGTRGVVSTACYIARTYGVRSAMPMFKALAACPQAVVVRPNMEKYQQVGRQVRAMMLELTPLVEPVSIDEAFLDLSGTQQLHGGSAAQTLVRFAARVEREVGISVSVGLSYCKFLAKIASDLDKPRGFAAIGQAEAVAFLADKPVSFIWGVGKVTQEKLRGDGFSLIGDLQRVSEIDLLRKYGTEGQRLWRLSHGVDTRIVSPDRETKSVSAETTFDGDIADIGDLTRSLLHLSEKVSSRLKAQELAGRTVSLKLKTADFKSRTRARALNEPTQLATRLFEAGRELLAREADGTRFRLIGIGVSELSEADTADKGDLIDTGVAKEKATETAIDSLRAKFGAGAVMRGLMFEKPRKR